MEPISTSILARARTSADAPKLLRMSATVDLAPLAARAPMVPTMKYEIVRVLFEFGLDMYGLKSGTPDGARKSAVAEWLRPPVV